MISVEHLISGLFYGGGQRVVHDLLKHGSPNLDQKLVLLGDTGSTPMSELADFVVRYDGQYNRLRTLRKSSWQLRKQLKQRTPSILHTHGLDADLIGALAVGGLPTRHVSHLHVTPPVSEKGSWKAKVRRRLFRWLTNRADSKFIAVSDAVRDQMASYYRLADNRIKTIRNGVNLEEFSVNRNIRNNGGQVIFGSAGRLAPMKGFSHLIEAAAVVAESSKDFQVQIAGSGSQLDELKDLAVARGVSKLVSFVGHVADMNNFYQKIDVFVLPSVSTEGLPLVVLEAMASGLPVIATRVGGTPEVIRQGISGVIVEPGEPGQLADAIRTIQADKDRRAAMGKAAADCVANEYSIQRVADEIKQFYQAIILE